jgi:hypothetical protein
MELSSRPWQSTRERAERGKEEREQVLGWSGDRLGSLASTLGGHKDMAEDGRGGGRCCPAWWPRAHLIEHVVCNSVGKVGVDLGQFGADFGPGPKTKIEAHTMLYVCH